MVERKIAAGLFLTLDGVIESPNQWNFDYFDDEMGGFVSAQMASADTLLLGRRTYEEFAGYWPNADSSDPVTGFMNNTPKVVVSTTLQDPEWQNSTVIPSTSELAALKQQPGRNLGITGSATLVRSLLQEGLLDELHLLIHPIVVGTGRRLFTDGGGRIPLELVEAKTFKTGVIAASYVPAGR